MKVRLLDLVVQHGFDLIDRAIEGAVAKFEAPQIEVEPTTWSDQEFENRLIAQRVLYAAKKAS